MKTFLCEILFSCLLAAPGAKSLDELTYGSALYAYHQEDYGQALLEILVAEQRGESGEDPARYQLARGSFAFKEGLYRLAADTFAEVAATELVELDRMRLAFHLARQHYRHGEWAALEAALSRIDLGASWRGRQRRHPEVTFMGAEAALARGDFATAEQALGELDGEQVFLAYGLFNLGVAHREAGNSVAAYDAFGRLGGLAARTEETWDLVQRGRLALAMMARQDATAVDAGSVLGTLPGESRYRDQALASYGTLAMERDDHELAARIWLTLSQRDGWSASHAVAHLGLPMSLERLASPTHALDGYRRAESVFESRLVSLQEASTRVRDPAWLDSLLGAFAEADDDQRRHRLSDLAEGLGADAWLQWLAGEDVHRVMEEWRELDGMANWLARLPPRIDAFEEVAAERRRRSATAAAVLEGEFGKALETRPGQGAMVGRRAELAARVAGLEVRLSMLSRSPARMDPDWMLALASDSERALVAQLSAMERLAAEHMPARDRERFEPRIRRLQGAVFWQIADDRSVRLRELTRQLDESRLLLADVDRRIERLADAEARFVAGVETDFLLLERRADEVTRRVAAARTDRERVIAAALQQGLERELAQTRQYLLTARIAIARATDQLAAANNGPGGDS